MPARELIDGLVHRLVEVGLHHRPHRRVRPLCGFAALRKSEIWLAFVYQAAFACASVAVSPALAEAEHLDELGHQPDKIDSLGSGLEKGNAGNPAGAVGGDQAGKQQRGNPCDTPVFGTKCERRHDGQE
jgi:hypothetical protein